MQRRPTGTCPSAWVYTCLATAQPRLGDVLKRMPPIRSGFFRTTPHLHLIAPVALPCLVGPLPSGACVSRTELGAAADAYRGALIGRFERASFDFGLSQHSIGTRKAQSPFATLLIRHSLRALLEVLRLRQISPCLWCHCFGPFPMGGGSGRPWIGPRTAPREA